MKWPSVLNRVCWHCRGVFIATPTVAALVLLLRWSGALQLLEWQTYDALTRLQPKVLGESPVAIVGITEDDVAALKRSTPDDATLAKLLRRLRDQQPVAIGLDLYRDQPEPPGTESLTQVFTETPNLIGIQKGAGAEGIETVKPPPALKAKGQVGSNDLPIDADKVIRRGLISLHNGEETLYGLGFYLALIYLDQRGITVEDLPSGFRLGKTEFRPLAPNEGSYVRTDVGGFQFLIHYRGGTGSFEQVSLMDVLANRLPPDWGRGKIILIGKVGESFKDVYFTPYSNRFGLAQSMPGVEIHANIVQQFIASALGQQPFIQGAPESLEILSIIFWAALGAVIAWGFRYSNRRWRWKLLHWSLVALSLTALAGISYGALLVGWWLPLLPGALAFSGSLMLITAIMARAGERVRQTFGRYLTDQVVANLLENPTGLKMGGERREITLLTSDLRGFTATSERFSPEEVIKILNFYFERMADVITKYEGTIDEFMGDGILVLFGAPTQRPDDALRAVACAVEMQLSLEEVNRQFKAWNLDPIEMGIGVNTGEVVVGNIGSEKRTKYGVVGSQVNLTYRIESFSTGGQVLISARTYELTQEVVLINGRREVKAKGVADPIEIYDVQGLNAPYNLRLTSVENVYEPLPQPLPLSYIILEGKQVGETGGAGILIQLSQRGGLVQTQGEDSYLPEPLTNLKLNFDLQVLGLDPASDVYAKVLDQPAPQPGQFYIYFSSCPPAVKTYLQALYDSLIAVMPARAS